MPLLDKDWKTLFFVYCYADKRHDSQDTIFDQYRQTAIGSVQESLFILETLESTMQKAAGIWASLAVACADKGCRQSFCSALRDVCFYENGPMWSLLDYALVILPSYRRTFYRNIEQLLGEAYQRATTAQNDLLRNRVNECIKVRSDFCVACQQSGAELRGATVVFLPNCAHTALCTPCFLAWSGASTRCPVCRVSF